VQARRRWRQRYIAQMRNSETKLGRFKGLLGRLVRGLWSQEGSIRQKVVRGTVWTFGSHGVTRLLGMLQTIILVRLLLPADFGTMRIAGFLLAAMGIFTRTGMDRAIIQRKEIDEETLNTAWTIEIGRNLLLFLAVFFAAPWAARFYQNPLISPILRLIAVRFLLAGFRNIGVKLLGKELRFRTMRLFSVVTTTLGIAFTVGVAFWLRSVWALAIGQVAFGILGLVGSYIIHPYRPRLAFNARKALSLIHFGKHILAAGVVVFLKTQLDDAILGKMLGMEALGFYTLAYKLSNLPARWITSTLSDIMFPAYSKLQDSRERLGRAFLKVFRVTCAAAVPAAAGLFILAPEIVTVVYGPRWAPMIPAFRVLCLFGLFHSLSAGTGPVFAGVGKPHIIVYLSLGDLVLMLSFIYPLTKAFGIVGTAWATVLPSVLLMPAALVVVPYIACFRGLAILEALAPSLVSASMMVVAVHLAKSVVSIRGPAALLGMVAFGAVVYCVCLFLMSRDLIREVKTTIGSVLDRRAIVPGQEP